MDSHTTDGKHSNKVDKEMSSPGLVLALFFFGGVNYLYLGTSGAFCLLLHTVCLLSRFLDERDWLVHDRRVVSVCCWRADGAGCGTPGGSGALRCVGRCCRCSLLHSFPATVPAQCTFSPRTFRQVKLIHLKVSFWSDEKWLESWMDWPLLQRETSVMAPLAFNRVHSWDSCPFTGDVSESVFTPEVRLSWNDRADDE